MYHDCCFQSENCCEKVVIQLSLMVAICWNCELSYNEATIEQCLVHAFFAVAELLVLVLVPVQSAETPEFQFYFQLWLSNRFQSEFYSHLNDGPKHFNFRIINYFNSSKLRILMQLKADRRHLVKCLNNMSLSICVCLFVQLFVSLCVCLSVYVCVCVGSDSE